MNIKQLMKQAQQMQDQMQRQMSQIKVEGTAGGSWSMRTGSGNAELRVPTEAAFDLDLSTSSGTVVLDKPVTTTVQGRVEESRRRIEGKVHGGGPLVSVHTGSGDVHIY